jgi:hypothetical protein
MPPESGSLSRLSIASALAASAATMNFVTINVPEGIRQASDLGRVTSTQEIKVTVQLQLQNQAAFDRAVDAPYDPAASHLSPLVSGAGSEKAAGHLRHTKFPGLKEDKVPFEVVRET